MGDQRQVDAGGRGGAAGQTDSSVRVDAADETIVSVAAPIQHAGGAIRGALLLSTQGGDIER